MTADLLALLRITSRTVKNSFLKAGRRGAGRGAVLAVIGALFLFGAYRGLGRVLAAFMNIPGVGSVLIEKLLAMVFLTFLFLLLFSNIIIAIATYYLSDDMSLQLSLPVNRRALFLSRYAKVTVNSSWMVFFMGLPIFAAYAAVLKSGLPGFLASFAALGLFLLIASSLGVTLTVFMMKVFPAKRIRDFFVFLSVAVVCALLVFIRLLQPEKLTNPNEQMLFKEFIASLQAPSAPYLPSFWASQAVFGFLSGAYYNALKYLGFLTAAAGATFALMLSVSGNIFLRGWWNSAENQLMRYRKKFFDRIDYRKYLGRLGPAVREMVIKDVLVFVRDSTQWPQLMIIVAINIIYVANISMIDLSKLPAGYSIIIKDVLFLVIMGFAGFVIASIAARFVFSSISIEGRSFWVVRMAPMTPGEFLKEKFWINFWPLLALSEVLVFLSAIFVKIDLFTCIISAVMGVFFSVCLTAMGVGLGAIFPKFDAANTAEIATSYGGILYMIFAIGYIGISEFLLAYPMHMYYTRGISFFAGTESLLWACLALFAFLLVQAAAFALPMLRGKRALERLEL